MNESAITIYSIEEANGLGSRRHSRVDERSPLLSNDPPNNRLSNVLDREPRKPTPLPKRELFVLCAMRFTEPVSYTLIFPFINQMIEDLHITPDRKAVGYYAGVIESLFALSQLCTVYQWGRLSDRIGRKPCLLMGLVGLVVSIVSFGLQKSFVGLVASRSLAGIMNGNVGIVKSVLAEITDETNQARAFTFLPMTFAVGSIIGSMIGGYLAKPAEQYPWLFGSCSFLIDYPYFLPCAVAGTMNFCSVVLGIFYLEETLPSRRTRPQKDDISSHPDAEEDRQEALEPPSLSSLLTTPVVLVLGTYMFLAFNDSSLSAVIPLFSYTRVQDGGLGLSLNQIGTALGTNGLASILVQTLIFPPTQKRLGTASVLRASLLAIPACFFLLPVLGWVTRLTGITDRARTAGLICLLAVKSLVGMAYVSCFLVINNLAPTQSALGSLNGLSQMAASSARALGPVVTTSLFALSIDRQVLGGYLIWPILVLISGVGWMLSLLVKDVTAAWRM